MEGGLAGPPGARSQLHKVRRSMAMALPASQGGTLFAPSDCLGD